MPKRPRRFVATLLFVLMVIMVTGPVVILCGWGGWMAFMLSSANPFTYKQPSEDAIYTMRQSGDAIVAALERWKLSHGTYPPKLSMLVPEELPSIPSQPVGDGTWKYWVESNGSFVLRIWVGPDYESEWWESGTKAWRVDY